MRGVLERAERRGFRAVRLVQAAYHSRSLSLYAKLGFVAREPLAVLQGKPIGADGARPARESDIEAANALCRRVHGHDRGQELLEAIRAGTASVVEREGRLVAYATEVGFFGHAVAETTRDLIALIAASGAFSGPGFLVPTRNDALFRWALEQGLRVVQPMTLMTMGLYNEPAGSFLPSILF